MIYLMNFINDFFDVIGCKITGCKSTFHNTAFQLLTARCNAM